MAGPAGHRQHPDALQEAQYEWRVQVAMAQGKDRPGSAVLHYSFQSHSPQNAMLLSREYVGYLARQVTQKLAAGDFIETKELASVTEALNNAILEELQLEDRINDEVRLILEQYQDEMRRAGASYQEMFKKVKGELVRKYKAVL